MSQKKSISIIILIIGIASFFSYHLYYYCLNKYHDVMVENFLVEYQIIDNYREEAIQPINYANSHNDYLGIISIPKINLQKEFYNIDDKRNNVNKNIEVLNGSVMPDIKGGALILAAHRGDSYLGYFNNIDQLELNDLVDIYYHNQKYTYLIYDKYEIERNGKISFTKNMDENYLILTTCSKNNGKQLVIVSKLVK